MKTSDISSITGKKCIFVFLGHFWTHGGQPHDHIGWATSMPFASINSTGPTPNFYKKYWELVIFFEPAIWTFCFSPIKIGGHKLFVRMDGTQFSLLWWFTAKNERGNDKRAWVYLTLSKVKQDNLPRWFCQ